MKPLFLQGPSATTRLVALAILSVALMAIDHRQHRLEDIRAGLSVLIYPLQYMVDLPVSASSWIGENLSSRETLLEENARFKMQQTLFKAQLQKLLALKMENARLRELLQSPRKISEHVLIGELLAVDLEPFTRQIVINKGSRDQVFMGQPVVDADGAFGQIVHLGPWSSTAMLITDANHAIPVQVNRNGLRAIALGTGAPDSLSIPYLPMSADILVGDLLTTSGLGGRFPPGYPVAKVTQVDKNPTLPYATISAQPTAQLERAREVLLVWPQDSRDESRSQLTESETATGSPP
ncbi:MAG: rod shape-determining protein MreC [Gammaproteobacteria bacterium]|nr:rod shape-determining protein MreC [Gammaproteobacteria bacterium]